MNPNRQNSYHAGRSMVRPAASCHQTSASAQTASRTGCGGIVTNTGYDNDSCGGIATNNATGCNTPCNSDRAGGIIFGQGTVGCNMEGPLTGMPVAMAYVPWQSYGNLYSPQMALQHGTLFQELNLDFAGRRCN